MAKAAGAALERRYGHRPLKTTGTYARRARTLLGQIAAIQGVIDVSASVDGIIRIEFDKSVSNKEAVLSSVSSLGISADFFPSVHTEMAGASDAERSHGHGAILGENTELILAILCGANPRPQVTEHSESDLR